MELLSLIGRKFGGRRATELIGWAILLGAAGIENGPKLRHALKEAGYSQSAFYRALADFRAFGEFVEQEKGYRPTVHDVVERLRPAV
jgi:hypothetical protein